MCKIDFNRPSLKLKYFNSKIIRMGIAVLIRQKRKKTTLDVEKS